MNPGRMGRRRRQCIQSVIRINAGDAQSGTVGIALGAPFSVVVRDPSGALASGVTVLWASNSDGTFDVATSVTNGSGVASATLTLGTNAGTQGATATVSGVGYVTFTATAVADVASEIVAVTSTDQTGSASTPVGTPPSVRVMDIYRNPITSQTVTFAVTAGSGSRSPATVDTGSDGIATLTSWTLGASVGVNTLTATVAGLTGSPVTFSASVVTATPTQIAVTAGGSQTGVVAGQNATAITYRVRDGSNNNLQGVTVAFLTNLGTLSVASAVTDASGLASVTLTTDTTAGTATVIGSIVAGTISASTTVVSTFGAATKAVIQTEAAPNGQSGTALPGQPVVRITDANGNTVTSGASSTLTVTVTITSGNATVTGGTKAAVAGVATFNALALTDIDGGVNIPTYTPTGLTGAVGTGITLAPPIPSQLAVTSTVVGVAAGAVLGAITVEVRDASNGVVPGAANAITAALTTPGGAALLGTTTVNASSGVATFNDLRVDTAGSYTLTFTATLDGLSPATSNSFTISAASGAHPNEPGGFTEITHIDLGNDTLATASAPVAGQWSLRSGDSFGGTPNFRQGDPYSYGDTFVGGTPFSPTGKSGRARFHTGTWGGQGPIYLSYGLATRKAEVYMQFGLQFSNPFTGNPSGVNKVWFIGLKTAAGGEVYPLYLQAFGVGTGALTFAVDTQGCPANLGGNSASGDGKFTAGVCTRDSWRSIEVYLKLNSAANVADGIAQVWMDDILKLNKTNLCVVGGAYAPTTSSLISSIIWNPTWGGGSGTIATEQYQFIDNVYLSAP